MLALSPFFVFMVVYIVGSLIAGDFYELPLTVAFLIASAYALGITPNSNSANASISSPAALAMRISCL